jgi:two-component SAPR family response regulator
VRDSRFIKRERNHYRLNLDSSLWLDVNEFKLLVGQEDLDSHRAAVELYNGQYLADMDADLPPDVEIERSRLEQAYIATLRRLVREIPGDEVLPYRERLALVDPAN